MVSLEFSEEIEQSIGNKHGSPNKQEIPIVKSEVSKACL